ncbi:MAG TPA: FG-GAP-like repeat-containing protein [bacterium]|nr:FG-GAP-like repeat-containing protein [bacterium]
MPTRLPARSLHPAAWLLAALLTAPAARTDAQSFTQQAQFGAGGTICVAWGDADGDQAPELAVGNTSGQNWLFTNDGGGGFTQLNEFDAAATFAMVWADYNDDGLLDIAVGNRGSANRLYENNGDGTFTGRNRLGNFTTISIAMAWADYDLDGDLDVAVGNGILGTAQQNHLYVNGGGNAFAQTLEFGMEQTQAVAWGDYDNDGDPDLAVGNGGFGFTGQNYLYVNNGDGTFTEVPEFGNNEDTTALAWGDADNDGDLDLAVANWNDGQNYLYRNDGGSFAALPRFGLRDPNTLNWGDYDNDGDLDLAVGNGDFGSADTNFLYINEGGLTFTESAQFGLGSTDGVAWGDVDLDGDLDLAVGNEHSPNTNYLYVNNENDADWLSLTLVGHEYDLGAGYSVRNGIGARITVYEAGFLGDPAHRLGYREVEAHGGFSCQNDLPAHFGLPGQSSVDVRIEWPGSGGSHITQDLTGVAVPGRGTIHEGADDVVGVHQVPAGAATGAAWRIAPNPTAGKVLVEYLRPLRDGSAAEIVDVTGRHVATIALGATQNGGSTVWDGRNANGRRAAPGVYFVNVAGSVRPGRITVVR